LYKDTLYSEVTNADIIIISGEVEAYISAFTPLAIYGKEHSVSPFCRLIPPGKESLYPTDR